MWIEEDNFLTKYFEFENFVDAFDFLKNVAAISEKLNHHPTIINTYNKVILKLQTHSQGNIITQLDWELAKEIDKLIL